MANFRTLDDADIEGKRVLVRVDFNVPMANGEVTDATRIERAAVTLKDLLGRGAKVVILSHFGRPKGERHGSMSLQPLVEPVRRALGLDHVAFAEDCIGETAEQAVNQLGRGAVVLLENLRFHAGEEKNDAAFADGLAALGEIYVNDAFSCSHRAHASVVGVAERLPAFAGRLMQAELEALNRALESPERPVIAVVGGAKVSTKLAVLGHLLDRVDGLVIGGGMANTFLHAQGLPVGKSLCEADLAQTAREIMTEADAKGCEIVLPEDVVVATEFRAEAANRIVAPGEVGDQDMIVDVGPVSANAVASRFETAKTILWNGPMGAFELQPFDAGTNRVAQAAAKLTEVGKLVSVAGGGDTVAALAHAGVLEKFTYVSAAGGAFLEWLEGRTLPGVAALAP
ncbi:MAG: phosphoglycerate kinase [Geminicoccaceae bacterium]